MKVAFLGIRKLRDGPKNLLHVARHNLLEIHREVGVGSDGTIDPERTRLNVVLRGPVATQLVADHAQSLMERGGIVKLRKDAVRALEILISLPADCSVDRDGFFDECVDWVERRFNVPLLSVVIHNDEPMPHIHLLILSLTEGRMNGVRAYGRQE